MRNNSNYVLCDLNSVLCLNAPCEDTDAEIKKLLLCVNRDRNKDIGRDIDGDMQLLIFPKV